MSTCARLCVAASVNGNATSTSSSQRTIDYLQSMFGLPVNGICNRTYGLWFDLLECIIQRDRLWPTTDFREGYSVSFISSK